MQAITQSAARAFWVTTGTTGLIAAQIDKHRAQFVSLAKRLLCDYEHCKTLGPQHFEGAYEPVSLVATRLNLINYDSDQFSEPGLLTLCLYAGYLTRMADDSTNYTHGALLQQLWRGKTGLLCMLATSSHGVLSNHNKYSEKDYANHVANTLMAVLRFGMLTHPKQKSVSISHVVPIRENHTDIGRCDYAMRLYSSNNQTNQFCVIVGFKLISLDRCEEYVQHQELAPEGLGQIVSNNYDACLVGYLERMDVVMAIGNSVVHIKHQLFRRKTVDSAWYPVDTLVEAHPF
ncbi:hypothetical protein LPJ66_010091 [Kickxella alabastrina]|uniref:Uncharacterized protein n=1 Tax=Kickxella alabastrina TaxID=61397 RepID=A0ACC1I3Z8_9FUNG|nr:hypothetical protein LPJ66_010091 [Kickxella alabastrina]